MCATKFAESFTGLTTEEENCNDKKFKISFFDQKKFKISQNQFIPLSKNNNILILYPYLHMNQFNVLTFHPKLVPLKIHE